MEDIEDNSKVTSKTGCATISGENTDVVVTKFKNLTFVIVTQIKKMGTLIEINYLEAQCGRPILCSESRTYLGKDEPEVCAVAKHLSERIFPKQTVLYSLALKTYSVEMVRGLGDLVEKVAKIDPLKI